MRGDAERFAPAGLETPALAVDLGTLDRNIAAMAAFAGAAGIAGNPTCL